MSSTLVTSWQVVVEYVHSSLLPHAVVTSVGTLQVHIFVTGLQPYLLYPLPARGHSPHVMGVVLS